MAYDNKLIRICFNFDKGIIEMSFQTYKVTVEFDLVTTYKPRNDLERMHFTSGLSEKVRIAFLDQRGYLITNPKLTMTGEINEKL